LQNSYRLLQLVFTCREARLVILLSVTRFPGVAVVSSFDYSETEKDLKPAVSSNSMDEDRSQKPDAALSHSDSGPLRRVRNPGGLESESLTLRSGSVLKDRSLHMSQISDPQALVESSAVTAQGQAVLSQSESESAITHVVSAVFLQTAISASRYCNHASLLVY